MNGSGTAEGRNPLVRDGTSQRARSLPALDPARAPVDGRDTAAYLEYLRRFSRKLQYWDLSNARAGDWEPFIARDVSSVAAAVAARQAERERRQLLDLARGVTRPGGGQRAFGQLLDALFGFVLRLDGWIVPGVEGLGFVEVLRREVHGGLRADLRRLLGIHAGARQLELLGPGTASDANARRVLEGGLSSIWWAGEESWAAFARVPPDAGVFGTGTEPERLARALEHLRPLLKSFPRVLAQMAEAATGDLDRTLADWPRHEPHMALVLAFLHLFRYALDDLDGLTARHLEHHFQEVLRLRPLGAMPDRVFVTFELAPHVRSHLLPADTVVAGKDGEGPLRYRLEEELRLDHTAVGPFMAIHRTARGILTASAVANSADGLGAPIPPERPGWPAFGSDEHPAATVGFAFATPVLLLAEGERVIALELAVSHSPEPAGLSPGPDLRHAFRIEITGAKQWIAPRIQEARLEGNRLRVALALPAEAPPVTGYQPGVHGGSLDTTWPVCRFLLVQDGARGVTYQAFSSLVVTGATVDVKVRGIRKLQMETDAGRVDPAKPTLPFGPQPLSGSTFSVHCAELRLKALASLSLDLQWLEPAPALDLREVYAGYALDPAPRPARPAPEGGGERVEVAIPRPVDRDTFQVEVSAGLASDLGSTPGSVHGGGLFDPATFAVRPPALSAGGQPRPIDTVRVRLVRPLHGFGHRLYPQLQAEAVLANARAQQPYPLPNPPITPKLAALSLAYSARAGFEDGFFHLHPFGETREQVGAGTPLLPRYASEGELYVGLAKTGTQQRISLLFQAVDGSGDPLLQAEKKVSWGYLDRTQQLQAFPERMVGDGTGGLVRSGLLRVVLPPTATDAGTRLPAGRFWLRASVPAGSAAACRLIAVHAQATSAVLLDAERPPAHLGGALPAGTVHQMERRQAAITKVHQPVASFGGRAPESPLAFARRASERLRHKQRAITPQDYEKLVLEAFPSLYKVKCLNHTRLDDGADIELAPGWVTIVTVPSIAGRSGHNPFAPYTSQATLDAVGDFLRPLMGPFVRLKVANPTYEPVRLGFTVKMRPEMDDPALGIARLQREINELLSPWAFGEEKDIVFGGAIYRSALLQFVEKRPYVDYVTDFCVSHVGSDVPSDEERIVARTSRSILVSAGAHDILAEPPEVSG